MLNFNEKKEKVMYLVVAKVSDYPNVDDVLNGITNDSELFKYGRWQEYMSVGGYFDNKELQNKVDNNKITAEEINRKIGVNNFAFNPKDKMIYEKASAVFELCIFGNTTLKDGREIAPYKDVVAEFGTPDGFYDSEHCFYSEEYWDYDEPFPDIKPDEMVYILSGYNPCWGFDE